MEASSSPLEGRILGSETKQENSITQSVTDYSTLAGAVCLIVWLEHLWHYRRKGVSKLEWGIWSFAAASVIVLAATHVKMDHLLSVATSSVLDPERFGRFHKLYILTSSAQWLACLVMLYSVVSRWNKQDTTKA